MAEGPSAKERLDSWKEIAAYLNRTERTVSRWEKKGLPVYRVPGGKKQAVFAYTHELEEWLKKGKVAPEASHGGKEGPIVAMPPDREPIPQKQVFWRNGLIVVVVLAVTVLGVLGSRLRLRASIRHPVTKIDVTPTAIEGFDDEGRLTWIHTFRTMLAVDPGADLRLLAKRARFIDMVGNGDRRILVTVPLRVGPNPTDGVYNEVDLFSNDGELLWSYIAQERFRFGSYDLEGPWMVNDVFVSSRAGKPVIWVALDHSRWGNSFVVQLDLSTGKDSLRFVNTGVIYTLNEVHISGKQYLLVAGFNNEYAAGTLAVIDESKPFAVSPQTDGTRHKCMNCPAGAPDYYFIFPRSEINVLLNLWEDSVGFINVHGEEIEIEKSEVEYPAPGATAPADKAHTVYVFHTQPTIMPFSLRFDSWYDLMHRDLEKAHELDHPLEACPERLQPKPVRVWTPAGEWKEIELKPVRAVD